MKRYTISPPIIIVTLLVIIIGITLFFFQRQEAIRERNMIQCKKVTPGMRVEAVIELMGEPDDIILQTSAIDNKDLIQYIYQAPLNYNKTMVVLFDVQRQMVVHVKCVDGE